VRALQANGPQQKRARESLKNRRVELEARSIPRIGGDSAGGSGCIERLRWSMGVEVGRAMPPEGGAGAGSPAPPHAAHSPLASEREHQTAVRATEVGLVVDYIESLVPGVRSKHRVQFDRLQGAANIARGMQSEPGASPGLAQCLPRSPTHTLDVPLLSNSWSRSNVQFRLLPPAEGGVAAAGVDLAESEGGTGGGTPAAKAKGAGAAAAAAAPPHSPSF